MEVGAVGVEWALPTHHASNCRHHQISDGDDDHSQGQNNRHETGDDLASLQHVGVDLTGDDDTGGSQNQSQRLSSPAHHDGRGVIVVPQEPGADPDQCNHDQRRGCRI